MRDRDAEAGTHLAPVRVALVGFTLLAIAAVALEAVRGDVSTTFEPRTRRPAAVVTDGRRVLEIEARTGRVAATLVALPTTGSERIEAVAPRPGALRGLPMLVLSEDQDGPRLWWLDEDAQRRELPDALRAPVSTFGGPQPVPVWSPDGSHVAWLEGTQAYADLRVVAWGANGPRADDPRHSATRLAGAVGFGARLEAWRWNAPGPQAPGTLLLSDDAPGLYELAVTRADGQVRPMDARPQRLPGALVDRADAGREPAELWPRYTLVLPMERGSAPQLRWMAADGSSGTLPLPSDMGGVRGRWWLDAFGPLVLVGDGQRAWALRPDGVNVEIPTMVTHGAVLERMVDTGDGAVTPKAPGRQFE